MSHFLNGGPASMQPEQLPGRVRTKDPILGTGMLSAVWQKGGTFLEMMMQALSSAVEVRIKSRCTTCPGGRFLPV